MNKCSKCGQEFEGKFCPNCGNPASGVKTCPKCGAELQGKFCSNCGYSADSESGALHSGVVSSATSSGGKEKMPPFVSKLYAFMPKIFPILFAVFAVLMLICFAGSVTKSELADEFGGTSDSVYSYLSGSEEDFADSWGDRFDMSAEDDFDFDEGGSGASLQGICAALVTFGVLAVAAAVFGLLCSLYMPLRAKRVKVGDRVLKLSAISNVISLVLLFVIFLLGCILCANAGGELGLSEPGAAPICIIFFSLFFGLLMGVALFGRKLISLIWTNAPVEYEAARAAERASLVEPLEPVEVARPEKPKKPSKYIVPDEVQNSVSDDEKSKIVRHIKAREAIAYVCMFPYTLVFGSIVAIIHYAGTKRADFWKVKNRDSIKASCALGIITAVAALTIGATLLYFFLYGYGTNVIADYKESKNDIQTLQSYSEMVDDYSDEEFAEYCFEGDNLTNFHSAVYEYEKKSYYYYSSDKKYKDSMCIEYFIAAKKYFMEGTGIQAFEQGYDKYCAPLMEFDQILHEYDLLSDYPHQFEYLIPLAEPFEKTEGPGEDVTVSISNFKVRMPENVYEMLFQAYQDCSEIRELYNAADEDAQTALRETIQLAERYGGDAAKIVSVDRELLKQDINSNKQNVESVHAYFGRVMLRNFLGFGLPCGVAAIIWLVIAIVSFKLLKTSNKYTQQVYGAKKVDKNIITKGKDYPPYKEALKQYDVDQREYKSYRKQYNAYLVELAYYTEGVARKHKA